MKKRTITKSQLENVISERLTGLLQEEKIIPVKKRTITKSQLESVISERLTNLLKESNPVFKNPATGRVRGGRTVTSARGLEFVEAHLTHRGIARGLQFGVSTEGPPEQYYLKGNNPKDWHWPTLTNRDYEKALQAAHDFLGFEPMHGEVGPHGEKRRMMLAEMSSKQYWTRVAALQDKYEKILREHFEKHPLVIKDPVLRLGKTAPSKAAKRAARRRLAKAGLAIEKPAYHAARTGAEQLPAVKPGRGQPASKAEIKKMTIPELKAKLTGMDETTLAKHQLSAEEIVNERIKRMSFGRAIIQADSEWIATNFMKTKVPVIPPFFELMKLESEWKIREFYRVMGSRGQRKGRLDLRPGDILENKVETLRDAMRWLSGMEEIPGMKAGMTGEKSAIELRKEIWKGNISGELEETKRQDRHGAHRSEIEKQLHTLEKQTNALEKELGYKKGKIWEELLLDYKETPVIEKETRGERRKRGYPEKKEKKGTPQAKKKLPRRVRTLEQPGWRYRSDLRFHATAPTASPREMWSPTLQRSPSAEPSMPGKRYFGNEQFQIMTALRSLGDPIILPDELWNNLYGEGPIWGVKLLGTPTEPVLREEGLFGRFPSGRGLPEEIISDLTFWKDNTISESKVRERFKRLPEVFGTLRDLRIAAPQAWLPKKIADVVSPRGRDPGRYVTDKIINEFIDAYSLNLGTTGTSDILISEDGTIRFLDKKGRLSPTKKLTRGKNLLQGKLLEEVADLIEELHKESVAKITREEVVKATPREGDHLHYRINLEREQRVRPTWGAGETFESRYPGGSAHPPRTDRGAGMRPKWERWHIGEQYVPDLFHGERFDIEGTTVGDRSSRLQQLLAMRGEDSVWDAKPLENFKNDPRLGKQPIGPDGRPMDSNAWHDQVVYHWPEEVAARRALRGAAINMRNKIRYRDGIPPTSGGRLVIGANLLEEAKFGPRDMKLKDGTIIFLEDYLMLKEGEGILMGEYGKRYVYPIPVKAREHHPGTQRWAEKNLPDTPLARARARAIAIIGANAYEGVYMPSGPSGEGSRVGNAWYFESGMESSVWETNPNWIAIEGDSTWMHQGQIDRIKKHILGTENGTARWNRVERDVVHWLKDGIPSYIKEEWVETNKKIIYLHRRRLSTAYGPDVDRGRVRREVVKLIGEIEKGEGPGVLRGAQISPMTPTWKAPNGALIHAGFRDDMYELLELYDLESSHKIEKEILTQKAYSDAIKNMERRWLTNNFKEQSVYFGGQSRAEKSLGRARFEVTLSPEARILWVLQDRDLLEIIEFMNENPGERVFIPRIVQHYWGSVSTYPTGRALPEEILNDVRLLIHDKMTSVEDALLHTERRWGGGKTTKEWKNDKLWEEYVRENMRLGSRGFGVWQKGIWDPETGDPVYDEKGKQKFRLEEIHDEGKAKRIKKINEARAERRRAAAERRRPSPQSPRLDVTSGRGLVPSGLHAEPVPGFGARSNIVLATGEIVSVNVEWAREWIESELWKKLNPGRVEPLLNPVGEVEKMYNQLLLYPDLPEGAARVVLTNKAIAVEEQVLINLMQGHTSREFHLLEFEKILRREMIPQVEAGKISPAKADALAARLSRQAWEKGLNRHIIQLEIRARSEAGAYESAEALMARINNSGNIPPSVKKALKGVKKTLPPAMFILIGYGMWEIWYDPGADLTDDDTVFEKIRQTSILLDPTIFGVQAVTGVVDILYEDNPEWRWDDPWHLIPGHILWSRLGKIREPEEAKRKSREHAEAGKGVLDWVSRYRPWWGQPTGRTFGGEHAPGGAHVLGQHDRYGGISPGTLKFCLDQPDDGWCKEYAPNIWPEFCLQYPESAECKDIKEKIKNYRQDIFDRFMDPIKEKALEELIGEPFELPEDICKDAKGSTEEEKKKDCKRLKNLAFKQHLMKGVFKQIEQDKELTPKRAFKKLLDEWTSMTLEGCKDIPGNPCKAGSTTLPFKDWDARAAKKRLPKPVAELGPEEEFEMTFEPDPMVPQDYDPDTGKPKARPKPSEYDPKGKEQMKRRRQSIQKYKEATVRTLVKRMLTGVRGAEREKRIKQIKDLQKIDLPWDMKWPSKQRSVKENLNLDIAEIAKIIIEETKKLF